MTLKPSLISFSAISGTVATRFSSGAVSFGTPMTCGMIFPESANESGRAYPSRLVSLQCRIYPVFHYVKYRWDFQAASASWRLSSDFHRTQQRGALTRARHDEGQIRAAQDEAHADANILLHQLGLVDSAHPRKFAVLATGLDHCLVRGFDLRIGELSRHPHLRAEIVGADEEDIHAFDLRDGICIGDRFRCFKHDDDE